MLKIRIVCAVVMIFGIAGLAARENTAGKWENNFKPKDKQDFVTAVWLSGKTFSDLKDKKDIPQVFDLFREVNINCAMGFGGRSDVSIANNFPFYLDRMIRFGNRDVGDIFARSIRKYYEGKNPATDKIKWFTRRPCLSDPEYVSTQKKSMKELARDLKKYSPPFYSLEDEPSITFFCRMGDLCYSEYCLDGFRNWLKEEYGDVKKLNSEWDTNYTSFKDAMPLTVDEVREKIGRSGKVNYAPWADHREFMDNVYNGFITDMRKILEAEDPGASAGIGGGQAPAHCTGYDYWKLMKASTSIEAYDIGNSIELTRSFNTDQHSLCVMSTLQGASRPATRYGAECCTATTVHLSGGLKVL